MEDKKGNGIPNIEETAKENLDIKKKKVKKDDLKFSFFEVLILVFITAIVTIAVTVTINKIGYTENIRKPIDSNIQKFVNEYDYITEKYYGIVDNTKLIENAIAGMVNGLGDPYSSFISGDNATNFDVELDGEFYGLGVEIIVNDKSQIEIHEVLKGTGAEAAGLQKGDIITAMDGESIVGLTTTTFRARMIQSKKMDITLTIIRGTETKDIKVTRTLVTLPSVTTEIYQSGEAKVGYLRIEIFASNTYEQFKEALAKLEAEGIDSLIVDVRSNTGGHLSVVTDVISEFLDSTHVIYQIKDATGIKKEYSKGTKSKNYDIVVMIDGASASAAELLASALKEQYNAKLLGTKSYGKSTVQEVIELENGAKYKITIKEWLTSNGNVINGVGINPDTEVNLNQAYFDNPSTETDNQLSEAIKLLKK